MSVGFAVRRCGRARAERNLSKHGIMWVGHSPMRVTLGWARCADNVADILRRGAWYPIVEELADGHVVVEVRQQRVRLPRGDVTIRTEVPDHWSIVARTGVLRPTLGGGRGSE